MAKHFLPYGAYVAACGTFHDTRYPDRWTDLRSETTCGDCQAQMTDHGDLPPIDANHQHDGHSNP